VSYPDGFAALTDLKRDKAIFATTGRDRADRTKRLACPLSISSRKDWSSV